MDLLPSCRCCCLLAQGRQAPSFYPAAFPCVGPAVCGRPRVATPGPESGSWFPQASLLTFQKRPQPTDFIDPLASKKPRISHFTQRAQPTLNGKLGAPNGHETLLPTPGPTSMDTLSSSHLPPRLEPSRTHDPLADVSNDLSHSAQDYKHQEATPAPAPHLSLPLLTDFTQSERPAGSSHIHSRPKKKSKKHKDKERPPEHRPPAPQSDVPATPALLPDALGENSTGVRTWGHCGWPLACPGLGAGG